MLKKLTSFNLKSKNLDMIQKTFANCHLNTPDVEKEFRKLVENKNSNSLKIQLPAKGSRVHVINEDERFKFLDGKYFTISWKGSGKYKSHVYCVSKNFRFVSLDHL